MNARRKLAAANWKMHKLRGEAEAFCGGLVAGLAERPADVEVVVFPSFPLLGSVVAALAGSGVAVGGQDVHEAAQGAHTGDVSAAQLLDAGASWALCGHSERRRDHGESDERVGLKAAAARAKGLRPLICVGETADERRRGETFQVLRRQLAAALAPRPSAFELAYEPVWAIGTGDTASPDQAQEVHAYLRQALASLVGEPRALATRILYGGSVKPDNAAELARRGDVDGFLIGGASLDVASFLAIIRGCAGE